MRYREVADLAGPQAREAFCSGDLRPTTTMAEEIVGDVQGMKLLLMLEGAEHSSRRRSIAAVFTAKAISSWSLVIGDLSKQAQARWNGSIVHLGSEWARPVAYEAAAAFVGIPHGEMREDAQAFAFELLSPGTKKRRRMLNIMRLGRLCEQALKGPVESETSPPNLFAQLKGRASDEDLIGVAMSMFTGGTELTSRALLASASHTWMTGSPPDSSTIDEVIAKAGIVKSVERKAVNEVQVGQMCLAPGTTVNVDLAEHLGDPDATAAHYPAFGFGRHYCIGAAWARMVCVSASGTLRESPSHLETVLAGDDDVIGGPVDVVATFKR